MSAQPIHLGVVELAYGVSLVGADRRARVYAVALPSVGRF